MNQLYEKIKVIKRIVIFLIKLIINEKGQSFNEKKGSGNF